MDLLLIASLCHDDMAKQGFQVGTGQEACPIFDRGGSSNAPRNTQKKYREGSSLWCNWKNLNSTLSVRYLI